jgi:hypothetical protein
MNVITSKTDVKPDRGLSQAESSLIARFRAMDDDAQDSIIRLTTRMMDNETYLRRQKTSLRLIAGGRV